MTLDQWLSEETRPVKEIADEIGISVAFLWRLRKGERTPGVFVVQRIAEVSGGKVGLADWQAKKQTRGISGEAA